MTRSDNLVKNSTLNEAIGKFFVLNKKNNNYLQGWMTIERTLKQFKKDIVEEIEYEWDSEKIFIENYNLFYIDLNDNILKEIRDDKTLSTIRRFSKLFIVLLDKNLLFSTIRDIPLLDEWYHKNLINYES
ncbi:MAG: hypothetical protein ACFE9Z_03305 [Promethearchaeota archaeon]